MLQKFMKKKLEEASRYFWLTRREQSNLGTSMIPGRDTSQQHEVMQQLDEEEEWRERTEVVTALDHRHNLDMARDLLDQALLAATSSSPVGTSGFQANSSSLSKPQQKASNSCR
ncbi:hypothetical protein E2C01_035699 [Portunus trituberculatus]|uniref:Uncharacterized protein n=1 Tax=Portunus trituberculatus TaxID=210409 RepID=A0A5B7F9W0_PORTR|nr:hypothetical protein [Portunus trituberculatus]